MDLTTYYINTKDNVISVKSNINDNIVDLDIDILTQDPELYKFIDEANRRYLMIYFNNNNRETSVGCISSKVIGLSNVENTLINPRYIINVFLESLKHIFKDNTEIIPYLKRDEDIIKIPTSKENISLLLEKILNVIHNDSNKIDDDDDDNDIINFKDIFPVILEYLMKLQGNKFQKKIKSGSISRKASIMGGINQKEIEDSLKDTINDSLNQTEEIIHDCFYIYKNEIYDRCKERLDFIVNEIKTKSDTLLYNNLNLSLRFMMETISEINTALFLEILPQKSLLNCLYATLYHSAVLNEMNLLEKFAEFIQLPFLYKLIYSCYQDLDVPSNFNDMEKYLMSQHLTLYKTLEKIAHDDKDNDELLCDAALKVDIQNVDLLDCVYWVLNQKKGYTFEFYLIVLASLFIKGKCLNLNKKNKLLNVKLFLYPLYKLFNKFYIYIKHEIGDLNVALCSDTFKNFSQLHSSDIREVLKHFTTNLK